MNVNIHSGTNTETEKELKALFKSKGAILAQALIDVVNELREYWPMTVRQVYYQAVARRLIQNSQKQYKRVSEVLTTLRRNDLLHWEAIEDRTRRTTGKRGVSDVDRFIVDSINEFLKPEFYKRCYIQNQPIYVEVATEKDALAAILEDAVWMYCTRLNVVRGQVSATMVKDIAGRFDAALQRGKQPVLLYFGDLDPSGVAIPKALQRNLYDHHSIEARLIRVALNPQQVKEYNLPVSIDAAKEQDPNYTSWLEEYGQQMPVELDALHPRDLKALAESALQSVYDMADFDAQIKQEQQDRSRLQRMRVATLNFLSEQYPQYFEE